MIVELALLLTMQSGVKLSAASAVVGGKTEVRLRWQIPEGWIPPRGLKLYRISGTTKTLVKAIPAPTDAAIDNLLGAKFKGKKLATVAATPLPPGSRLNFGIVRAPSALAAFQQRKTTAAIKPSAPGTIRRTTTAPVAGGAIAPRASLNPAAAPQRPTALKVRSDLHLAALVDARNAETLGLGATDPGAAAGATVNYALFAVSSTGQDGAQLGVLNGFKVGADTPPAAPTGLVFFQEDEEIHLRWTRLPAATEAQYLAASYRIYRSTSPTEQGTLLTPKPLMIMDLEGKEPTSFFVDELARPGSYSYRVVLVDGFNRTSPPAVLPVAAAEWRRPSPPANAFAGPGEAFRIAFKGAQRGEFRLPVLTPSAAQPAVRPTISWRSSAPLDGMAVKYVVYRYDLDQPAAPATKLTPSPIDGSVLPTQTAAQLESAIDAVYGPGFLDELEAKVQLIAQRPASTPSQILDRNKDAALARAKLGAIKTRIAASFRSSPPRQFVDASAARDHKFLYAVTAQFAPFGLESDEVSAGGVAVPDHAKPPAVTPGVPKFVPSPPPPKTFSKVPLKGTRSPFVGGQIRSRSAAPKTAQPRTGKPLNPKNPLMIGRMPLKLNLPPRDFGGTVELAWTGLNLKEVRYRVRRRLGGEPFADVGLTAPGVATIRDTVPRSRARAYDYEITAISRWNVVGVPATLRVPVPATIAPETPNILSAAIGAADGEILVRVEAAGAEEGVVKYRFFRDNQAAGEVLATAAAQGVVAFRDIGRAPGTKHSYTAEAETGAGVKSPRSSAVACAAIRTTVAVPGGLTGTPGVTGVVLRWTASPGGAGYLVRRKVGAGTPVVLTPRTVALTFTDVHAMRGRSYVYEVLAVDAQGNVSAAATVAVSVP